MEEKFMMSLHKPFPLAHGNSCHSPDTDKTDMASSVERNSPLSTSLASSESLSTSLKSSELRNLQQLVENPITEIGTTFSNTSTTTITGGINIADGQRITPQTLDLASSANTATNMFNVKGEQQNELRPSTSAAMKSLTSSSTTSYSTTTTVTSSNNPTITHMHPSGIQPSTSKTYNPPTD